MSSRKYKGFISYSSEDAAIAKWLQRALETYRLPPSLVGQKNRDGVILERKLGHIFRDRTDLASSASLSESIKDALRRSDFLIVLCSQRSATSTYVRAEIDYFLSAERGDRILAVLVDGEPGAEHPANEALPPQLRASPRDADDSLTCQPLAADLRPNGDGRHAAKLKLVAGLVSLDLDQLLQRERQRNRQRVARLSLLVTALIVAFAALGVSLRNAKHRVAIEASQKVAIESLEATRTGDPTLGLQLAIEALPKAFAGHSEADTPIAQQALRAAVGSLNPARLEAQIGGHDGWIETVRYLQRGEYFLTLGNFDKSVRMWRTDDRNLVLVKRYGTGIGDMDTNPDGTRVAFATYDQTALVWDPRNDRIVHSLTHDHDVRTVRFAPASNRLVTIKGDGRAVVWNTESGQRIASFGGNEIGASGIAFDPILPVLYVWGESSVWAWNYEENVKTKLFAEPDIEWLAVLPAQPHLVTANEHGSIKLWNSETSAMVRELDGPTVRVSAMTVDWDGAQLLVGYEDGAAIVWDLTSGQRLADLQGHTKYVSIAQWLPNNDIAITASGDGSVRLWDINTEVARLVMKHPEGVNCLGQSPDGEQLLTGDFGNVVHVWRLQDGQHLWSNGIVGTILDASEDVGSPPTLIVAGKRKAVEWDGGNPAVLRALLKREARLAHVKADGHLLITIGDQRSTVEVRDLTTGALVGSLLHDNAVDLLSISGDGTLAVTATRDESLKNSVSTWRLSDCSSIGKHEFDDGVEFASTNLDGRYLAVGDIFRVRVLRPVDGSTVAEFEPGLSGGPDVGRISPSGQFLALGCTTIDENMEIELWQVEPPIRVLSFGLADYQLTDLAFSSNERLLLTSSGTGELGTLQPDVRVWDTTSGFQIARALESNGIVKARFLAGSTESFLAFSDKHVSLWQFQNPEKLTNLLQMAKALTEHVR